MEQRLDYIDALKGLAIIILLAHHIPYVALNLYGLHNNFFEMFAEARLYIYCPYFMTLFFLTSGLCSNYDKPFEEFIKKSILVIIPCYILCREIHWFIDAFILSKIIYFVINKYVKKEYIKITICIALGLIACVLHGGKFYHEMFAFHHAFEMVLFMHIGHKYKNIIINKRYEVIACFIYTFVAILCYLLLNDIPYFESDFHVLPSTYLPFTVLAISGTMMLLLISRVLNNRLLRYLGRMSIVVFCLNISILNVIIPFLWGSFGKYNNNYFMSFLLFVGILLATILVSLTAIKILDNKYTKFIIGK